MFGDVQMTGDFRGGLQFDLVTLIIVDGQRDQPVALYGGECSGNHRIESAGQ